MKSGNIRQRLELELKNARRELSNPRFRAAIIPIISLLVVLFLGQELYYRITRLPFVDYPYPTFIIEEPLGNYNLQAGIRYITLSPGQTKLTFYGVFYLFANDSRMPNWGDNTIYIYVEADGKIVYRMSIPSIQQTFEIPLDTSNLSSGKHSLKLYATHRADWRTWKSSPTEYEITIEADRVDPPLITSLSKVKDNIYLLTGYVAPNSWTSIEGAKIISNESMHPSGQIISTATSALGTQTTEYITPNESGYFWVYLEPADSGQIQITTRPEYGAKSSNPITINISEISEFSESLDQPSTDVMLTIGIDRIDKSLSVRLSASNLSLAKLLRNEGNPREFVSTVVGPLMLNQIDISGYFSETTPRVTIKDGKATVTLSTSNNTSGDLNPVGESKISISKDQEGGYRTPFGKIQRLQITIADYSVVSVSPTPDSIEGSTYIWNDFSKNPQIDLVLRQSLGQLLRNLPRWSLFDFVGKKYIVAGTINLLMDLVSAMPIFGLVWLTSTYVSDKKEWRPRKHRIMSLLITAGSFVVLPGIWSLVDMLKYQPRDILQNYELVSYIQYHFPESLKNFRVDSEQHIVGFILLIGIIAVSLYLIWFTDRFSSFLGAIFKVLFRASLIIFSLQLALLFAWSFLGDPDKTQISLYSIWIISGLILYMVGSDLLIRISSFINRYQSPRSLTVIRIRFIGLLIVLALSAAIAYSIGKAPLENYNLSDEFESIYFLVSALSSGAMLFSAFSAVLLVVTLSKMDTWNEKTAVSTDSNRIVRLGENQVSGKEKFWKVLGLIFFVGYIIGMRDAIFSFPVSALVAIIVFRYVFAPQEKIDQINFLFEKIHNNRSKLLTQLANDLAATKLYSKLSQLLVNLSSGKITPSEYDASETIIKKEIEHIENEKLISEISSKDFVLAVGPDRYPINNAFLGSRWAFWLQVPLLFLLFNAYISEGRYSPWVSLLVSIFSFIFRWVIIGFTFGLFYERIRGNNGLRKALTLTLAIMVAYLPYRLILSSWSTTLQSFVLQMGFTALFLLALGLLFDWETLKRHGYGISYMQVVFSDMPSMVYASSFLLTTLTVVITTVLSGQLTQVLTAIVNGLLPVITNTPTVR